MREDLYGGEPGVVEPLDDTAWDDHKELMSPTQHNPGSEEKIALLGQRLAAGLPLWIAGDKTDHTSTETRREVFAVPFGHGRSLFSGEGDDVDPLD